MGSKNKLLRAHCFKHFSNSIRDAKTQAKLWTLVANLRCALQTICFNKLWSISSMHWVQIRPRFLLRCNKACSLSKTEKYFTTKSKKSSQWWLTQNLSAKTQQMLMVIIPSTLEKMATRSTTMWIQNWHLLTMVKQTEMASRDPSLTRVYLMFNQDISRQQSKRHTPKFFPSITCALSLSMRGLWTIQWSPIKTNKSHLRKLASR